MSVDKEVAVRTQDAGGAPDLLCGDKKLKLAHNKGCTTPLCCPTSFIGAHPCSCTTTQMHKLEAAHPACLRHLLVVNRAGCHTLQLIHSWCDLRGRPIGIQLIVVGCLNP